MANNSILIQTKNSFLNERLSRGLFIPKRQGCQNGYIYIFLNGRVYPFEGGFKKF